MTAHKGLAEALAAFQAEAPTFTKTKTARVQTRTGGEYTYKYADLGDILPVVAPLLSKHGLSWSAKPARADDGEPVLRYRLLHVSGETDGDEMFLGVDKGCRPQEMGSAITYARRYALTAQLSLVTEEDDDGQTAQNASRRRSNGAQPTAAPAAATERIASAKQRSLIFARAGDLPPEVLANVVLVATGNEPREFSDVDAAGKWVQRALDRLPARQVNAILEGIKAELDGDQA